MNLQTCLAQHRYFLPTSRVYLLPHPLASHKDSCPGTVVNGHVLDIADVERTDRRRESRPG